MSDSNESVKRTVIVALALCIVCSVIVSAAAVILKPMQVKNKKLDIQYQYSGHGRHAQAGRERGPDRTGLFPIYSEAGTPGQW